MRATELTLPVRPDHYLKQSLKRTTISLIESMSFRIELVRIDKQTTIQKPSFHRSFHSSLKHTCVAWPPCLSLRNESITFDRRNDWNSTQCSWLWNSTTRASKTVFFGAGGNVGFGFRIGSLSTPRKNVRAPEHVRNRRLKKKSNNEIIRFRKKYEFCQFVGTWREVCLFDGSNLVGDVSRVRQLFHINNLLCEKHSNHNLSQYL